MIQGYHRIPNNVSYFRETQCRMYDTVNLAVENLSIPSAALNVQALLLGTNLKAMHFPIANN